MSLHAKIFLFLGAVSAAASVVLGAVAAHSPDVQLTAALPLFQTALQYHQFHALGLLIVGATTAAMGSSAWLNWSGWLMAAGTLLFSGHLYMHSLAAYNGFHALAPIGGSALIVAWLLLAIGILTGRGTAP